MHISLLVQVVIYGSLEVDEDANVCLMLETKLGISEHHVDLPG